ncbi:MAG: hypothetical protein DWQ34_09595 [Planctomycetota bacterium]|nr:MAG: hypothetical protein DWQ29_07090 [Planctomycetota bacterium]REJ93913.1 MAG: hypothetical protein DWQ34_09595 [Planctomycetota bacterium]REK20681.1 MAG: hypothetical protein DWQ41_23830 [Planctomycetota bacterium]REK38137.1 MAG: hypothetical protein DWQ45_05720 [Planctomycetota bacterium]
MNRLAEELNQKLQLLDPVRAERLEMWVREAIDRVDQDDHAHWPDGYFDATAGALAGERLERAPQGELPQRTDW